MADPFSMPAEWHSIHKECALARQLIGSGVTALGKASHTKGSGAKEPEDV